MRTQFSKLALAATFGIALAFTFSCSSDDGDEGGGGGTSACKFTETIVGNKSVEMCKEKSEELVKADFDKYNAKHDEKISLSEYKERELKVECEDPEGGNGEYYESCPSGYVLKCSKGKESTYYFYGNESKDIDCDWFFDNRK